MVTPSLMPKTATRLVRQCYGGYRYHVEIERPRTVSGRRSRASSTLPMIARKSACVHRYDFITPYVADLANVLDMEAITSAGVDRHRPARRRRRALLAKADVDAIASMPTIVNDMVDPCSPLHDRGLGRQDPDGLFLALRDGAADRRTATSSTSPLPTLYRRRPPRRRHSLNGLMNPNPLSCRRDFLSV